MDIVTPFELTAHDLTQGLWRFWRATGVISDVVRFLPGGGIAGYTHRLSSRWELQGNALVFVSDAGKHTTRFLHDPAETAFLTLRGQSALMPGTLLFLQRREWGNRVPRKEATRVQLATAMQRHGWEIGDHTYGKPRVIERTAHLRIGKYTSIAEGVQIVLGNHRMDTASTYPFPTLRAFWTSVPADATDHTDRGEVWIGSDVWLGAGCFIGAGVRVGDGAVVGAHAIVLRDVPPYAVAVGNPARILRYRFDPAVIEGLLDIAWWDWPDETVDRFLPLILSTDIQVLIDAARAEMQDGLQAG